MSKCMTTFTRYICICAHICTQESRMSHVLDFFSISISFMGTRTGKTFHVKVDLGVMAVME